MRNAILLAVLVTAACALASAGEGAKSGPANNPPPPAEPAPAMKPPELPEHFANLKVLPETTTREDMRQIMRGMSGGLGVRCDHCHVKGDWAADTEKKEIARGMMKLTNRLNTEIFTWPQAPRATCFMCHHGEATPTMTPPPMHPPTAPTPVPTVPKTP